MATVAIGHIHGNLAALQNLLPKVLARVGPQDTTVLPGDYIDRGAHSRGCLESIIRLKDEAPCPVGTLIGSHEDWMLKSLGDFTSHSWILGMEAFEHHRQLLCGRNRHHPPGVRTGRTVPDHGEDPYWVRDVLRCDSAGASGTPHESEAFTTRRGGGLRSRRSSR